MTITGDGEVRTFTPILQNWTIVGTPFIVGRYLKKGKSIQFWISVSPPNAGDSLATVNYTSSIKLPWTLPTLGASGNCVVSDNTYGSNCMIDQDCTLHMPTIPTSGFSFNISGTIYIA